MSTVVKLEKNYIETWKKYFNYLDVKEGLIPLGYLCIYIYILEYK